MTTLAGKAFAPSVVRALEPDIIALVTSLPASRCTSRTSRCAECRRWPSQSRRGPDGT
jgi:hypothetical protein